MLFFQEDFKRKQERQFCLLRNWGQQKNLFISMDKMAKQKHTKLPDLDGWLNLIYPSTPRWCGITQMHRLTSGFAMRSS